MSTAVRLSALRWRWSSPATARLADITQARRLLTSIPEAELVIPSAGHGPPIPSLWTVVTEFLDRHAAQLRQTAQPMTAEATCAPACGAEAAHRRRTTRNQEFETIGSPDGVGWSVA